MKKESLRLIHQFDGCGVHLGFYFGEAHAAKATGISKKKIIASCEGNYVKAGGFFFSYVRKHVFKSKNKYGTLRTKTKKMARGITCNECTVGVLVSAYAIPLLPRKSIN